MTVTEKRRNVRRTVNKCDKANVDGFVVYEGPSLLNPAEPIVALLVPSTNVKTDGGMQLWILLQDLYPVQAIHSGRDSAICGDCKYRRTLVDGVFVRPCYVIPPAMAAVWKMWKAERYFPLWELESDILERFAHSRQLLHIGEGEFLRGAAYGDPAAVPLRDLLKVRNAADWGSEGWYTHQWANPNTDQGLRQFCMASVDSLSERLLAKAMGWRTFRVDWRDEGLQPGEMWCLATEEGGKRGHCASCSLCFGLERRGAKDQVVKPHGASANLFKRSMLPVLQ